VAYRGPGDTTRFRYFNGFGAPAGGWARASDTVNAGAQRIGFCGEIGRAAHIQATAPRDPTSEDSLPVWRRR